MAQARPLDDLIGALKADLKPVRRLAHPALRALAWLGIVGATGLALAAFADLPEIAHRLETVPDMWLAVMGSTLTFVLGAIATFELSLPDRQPAWAWLPAPGLALWVGASGLGCLRSRFIPDMHAASMHEAKTCFVFIVGLSVPLSILLVLMIRRACPLRPGLTTVVGGLTVAAAAATLLNFFHPYDVGAIDLGVHVAAVALVILANRLLAGRLLNPSSRLGRL